MITYRTGDVTRPVERPAVLAHVCNNAGRFGGRASVATAIAARWPHVPARFLAWPGARTLGATVVVRAEPGILVANMVAQDGLPSRTNPRPLNLPALHLCLQSVARVARTATIGVPVVVMPRIGTGYGGHPWTDIEPLIAATLPDVPVTIYDLPA